MLTSTSTTTKLAVLCALFLPLLAGAQQAEDKAHPRPSDIVSAFQSISVVINKIDRPLSVLSTQFDSPEISEAMRKRRVNLRGLASKWAGIIDLSKGKEIPSASDLFTIYTEMLDIQSFSAELTRDDRFTGNAAHLASDATIVIRGETELLPVLETLKYAVADRIDYEEAACLKRANGVGN
jgi:hypothetical protein